MNEKERHNTADKLNNDSYDNVSIARYVIALPIIAYMFLVGVPVFFIGECFFTNNRRGSHINSGTIRNFVEDFKDFCDEMINAIDSFRSGYYHNGK